MSLLLWALLLLFALPMGFIILFVLLVRFSQAMRDMIAAAWHEGWRV